MFAAQFRQRHDLFLNWLVLLLGSLSGLRPAQWLIFQGLVRAFVVVVG